MFSKEESKRIRQEFWTSFGQEYPRKWLLYNTKIKELSLKFTFTTKFAQVSIDIDSDDEIIKAYYYEKIWSLENILKTTFIPGIILDPQYEINYGKHISRAYIQLDNVSIHNKKTWNATYEFLYENMAQLELFFYEYEDFIKG
ncbi:DUF4268 domain-containing protein [Aquimarina agarilytica]|uniref:DUF4268 domain-containing protein n=1 Tax=Aquimarina agarilytica TaxID=1087449 RepID=UPI0002890A81|nr:DUF4268 domain-containing protein [Aquimarina agarilytica]